jgi:O-acetyl-ADP-ribose deacetylase (regulator of RNase III)
MKTIKGDLIQLALNGKFDVIVHGCNCYNTMGAGIAKEIKRVFPEAYEADCKTQKGQKGKLGSFSHANVKRGKHDIIVVNAYTQHKYWGEGRHVDYNAVFYAFEKIKDKFTGKRFGIPLIGAGLAGGFWKIIEAYIRDAMKGEDIIVVEYKPA